MTASTGLVYDERFLLHRAPYDHPEHPGRLSAIWNRLEADGLAARCRRVAAREATREELLTVHTGEHVRPDRSDRPARKRPARSGHIHVARVRGGREARGGRAP